jgi:hypothetical protein
MNNTTKKIIYVIKDDGNNYYNESIVSLHETKESAELSMATLESANSMRRFWIEEMDLFCLGKSNDDCLLSASVCDAVTKIPSDQLQEAYKWTCEYLKYLKQRMADDIQMEQESMIAEDIRAEESQRMQSINS